MGMIRAGRNFAKFPAIGTTVSGVVISPVEERQQTEFGTGRPLTWDDGLPRMEWLIDLEGDDGDVVTLALRGQLAKAVTTAVRRAGDAGGDPQIGGHLTVEYTADAEAKRGLNAAKVYSAKYVQSGEKPPF